MTRGRSAAALAIMERVQVCSTEWLYHYSLNGDRDLGDLVSDGLRRSVTWFGIDTSRLFWHVPQVAVYSRRGPLPVNDIEPALP